MLGAMDFRFIGASMGSVVGEKVTRAFELATAERLPDRARRPRRAARACRRACSRSCRWPRPRRPRGGTPTRGLPYVSDAHEPHVRRRDGVVRRCSPTSSSPSRARVIGFAGPRVVEQTIRQKLPKGFQTAESCSEHGMIDEVVPRAELRETVALAARTTCRARAGGARPRWRARFVMEFERPLARARGQARRAAQARRRRRQPRARRRDRGARGRDRDAARRAVHAPHAVGARPDLAPPRPPQDRRTTCERSSPTSSSSTATAPSATTRRCSRRSRTLDGRRVRRARRTARAPTPRRTSRATSARRIPRASARRMRVDARSPTSSGCRS